MAAITLHPGRLSGVLTVPPSKSVAHRAIICAALAKGESVVSPVDVSDDMRATLQCMTALGAHWQREGDTLRINGQAFPPKPGPDMDCLESGSTLRFVIPLSLVLAGGGTFHTKGRLRDRPLGPYESIFKQQGITLERTADGFFVKGKLTAGQYELPGDVSSQFVTGLLLALPLLEGDSQILLTSHMESEGYVQLTLNAMEVFGVTVQRPDAFTFLIPGSQAYKPCAYQVEGDYSQAAVMLCAGALGSNVRIKGLNQDSHQGDRAVAGILEQMGAAAFMDKDAFSMECRPLHGLVIDGGQIPDTLPMLALTMCLSQGESRIENAGRLRLKECDRLHATVTELTKLGADIHAEGDALVIRGRESLTGGESVISYDDHRMAMMLSIAALHCQAPIVLDNPACVKKSWPSYWEDYLALGGNIT